jgi:tRNA (mo5U34)-methyltransferase
MNRSQAELERTIRDLRPWFHNLHLPGGLQTCPDHFLGDFPSRKWMHISKSLPERLDGWRILDIGCNAGFYSFSLASRGAFVTAIDTEPHYLRQAAWARQVLGLEDRVDLRRQSVYSLARTEERYDLVLFLGVFYHLRYPLLGLDIVSRLVGRQMIFQTMTMPGEEVETDLEGVGLDERGRLLEPGWPRMAFIERELAGDRTNWWCPSHACVEAMLRSSGLSVVERIAHEIYLCEADPDGPSSFWRWDRAEYDAATGSEGD